MGSVPIGFQDWLQTREKDLQEIPGGETILPVQELWDNTISLEKNLQNFKVCWIIDGLDEQTNQCVEFLQTLSDQFGDKHFFLITTRPEVKPPSSLPLVPLDIYKLDEEQIDFLLYKLTSNHDELLQLYNGLFGDRDFSRTVFLVFL